MLLFPSLRSQTYRNLYKEIGENGRYEWNDLTASINFAGVDGRINVELKEDTALGFSIELPGTIDIEYPSSENDRVLNLIKPFFLHLEQQHGEDNAFATR